MRALIVTVLGGALLAGALTGSPAVAAPAGAECWEGGYCRGASVEPRSAVPGPSLQRRAVDPAGAPSGTTLCDDGSGAYCGTIEVPVDYRQPAVRTLTIAFKFYRHSTAEPAISTILYFDGAGESAIQNGDGLFGYALGAQRSAHDLLFIDLRGRGSSDAIDCPQLQHGFTDLAAAVRECADVLGADVAAYSSANDARDVDAVRAQLGIEKVDVVGKSYGGMQALAYVSRYPTRIRSIIFANATTPESNDYRQRLINVAAANTRNQVIPCSTSDRCRSEVGDPRKLIADAVRDLDAHPLVGSAPDLYGTVRTVEIHGDDVEAASSINFGQAAQAWLLGAIRAWRAGDDAPLLRVIATVTYDTATYDVGPSDGPANAGEPTAQDCADNATKPWRLGLTEDQRIASLLRTARSIPSRNLYPWNADTLARPDSFTNLDDTGLCAWWPDVPDADPVVPRGAQLPDVPVLAMVSGLDPTVPTEETLAWAKRFRHVQVITMPQGPHPYTMFVCRDETQQFLRTLGSVPRTCATDWHWYLQPCFPRTVSDVTTETMRREAGDRSTRRDRKLAETLWRTVLDGWISGFRETPNTTPGLRGGSMDDEYADDAYLVHLTDYRLTSDAAVTGTLTSRFGEGISTGEFRVVRPDGSTVTLALKGDLEVTRDGVISITGTVDGRPIALTTSSY